MTREEIALIINKQRAFFNSGATLPVSIRIDALKKLRNALKEYESDLTAALTADLGKSAYEGFKASDPRNAGAWRKKPLHRR